MTTILGIALAVVVGNLLLPLLQRGEREQQSETAFLRNVIFMFGGFWLAEMSQSPGSNVTRPVYQYVFVACTCGLELLSLLGNAWALVEQWRKRKSRQLADS